MFRGGPVDSYNTGITSGLGQPKRGLVDGPGGYSGELITRKARARFRGPQDFGITNVNPFFNPRMNIGTQRKPNFVDTPLYEEFPEVNQFPLTADAGTIMTDASVVDTDTGGIEDLKNTADVEAGLETTNLNPEKIDNSPTVVKTPKGGDDEPEVTMTDLEKALGLDKARQEYAADALAAASAAFFEGKGFGAIADAAKVKSKAPDIKRLAGLEEFKAKKAKELYDAQTKAKRFAPGNVEKTVEYLMRQGMDKDEAIRRATKQSGSFAEALSKHKTGPAILPTGFALAAEEFYGSEYKGDEPTDGSMPIGTKAEISDGVYTDKSNKIIFEIKDKIVVFSRKYSE
tara:strand:+ start:41 stop:1072 length:1032 start_codon:yes stop_codon:yes gene_type:complete